MLSDDFGRKVSAVFDRLGRRRYAIPVLGLLLFACLLALVAYPMATAAPKNVPVAVASFDEGAETPAGQVNVGQQLAAALGQATAAAEGDAPFEVTELDSPAAVEAARSGGGYYVVAVVPAGYTAALAASQAGAGEPQPVEVTVNQAKGPTVAAQAQSAVTTLLLTAGAKVETDVADPLPAGVPAASQPITAMFAFMLSWIASIMTYAVTRPGAAAAPGRRRLVWARLGYAAGLSALVALFLPFLIRVVVGAPIAFGATALYLWAATFALMVLFTGLLSVSAGLGMGVVLVVLGCGMAAGNLPFETLPVFWQDWFYPWTPQPRLAEGARQIYFLGGGPWNNTSLYFLAVAGLGLAAHAAAWLHAPRAPTAAAPPTVNRLPAGAERDGPDGG
jgi:uncharacterized phage infection (PIP) family protein YhgE